MSLKSRKFSLDSSITSNRQKSCWDGVGLNRVRRGSGKKTKSNPSLDDTQQHFQELTHSPPSNVFSREQTIAEESIEGADGLVNSYSFGKHNKSFHKLFPEIPETESLTHAFTCALQKDGLYQGKLYVSENHVSFHSSVLRKDTRVVIPLLSVREVKKNHSAMSMSIQTANGEKYLFVSLMNRGMCFKLLQSVCSHAQMESTNSSPHVSSGENEFDFDVISTNSSMDDSIDNRFSRENSIEYDDSLQHSSEVHHSSKSNSTRPNAGTDDEDNRGWIWRVGSRIASLFFFTEISNLQLLFHIYVILMLLLLLASGYIGMRIIALEEQLVSLSSISPTLHRTQYKET